MKYFFSISLFLLFIYSSCSKDDGNNLGQIEINSQVNSILVYDTAATIVSVNHTSSSQVGWSIDSKPDWISINPSSGMLGNGTSVSLEFSSTSNLINPITLEGDLVFADDNGTTTSIDIRLRIVEKPQIAFSPDTLVLTEDNSYTATGLVRNIGTGTLDVLGISNSIFRLPAIALEPNQSETFSATVFSSIDSYDSGVTVREWSSVSNSFFEPQKKFYTKVIKP